MPPDHQLGFDAGADGDPGFDFSEEPSIEHRPAFDAGETAPAPHGPDAPKGAAEATGQVLDRAGQEVPLEAGLPQPVAEQVAENHSVASGKPSFEPELEPVPHVDNLSMKRQKLKAAELHAQAEKLKALKPEDFDPEFIWDGKYTKGQALEQIRAWTKEGAAQAHPDASQMYDIIQKLEDEASAIADTHKAEVKAGRPGIPNAKQLVQAKWAEKAAWKEELKKIFPRTWDHESGVWKPGYEDLNNEYRRWARPEPEAKARPDFKDPKIKQWEEDQAEHLILKEKADKAEAGIKFIEAHHAELDAQDAVIERNRIKIADAKAAQKAADREAKLAQKQISDAKKAAERKAIKAEQDAARAQARAEAKAEREAKAAARKAEREAASAEAARLRAHERRIEAQVKANGKKIKFPRAHGEPPKSSKTTSGTHVTEGPDGKRTETHTRTERNGVIKEKIRIKIHAPKEPRAMRFDGYEKPFSGDLISKIGLGGAMSGMGHVTSPIAWGMTAANLATHIASHRQAIGKAFMKVAGGINKIAVPTIAIGGRTMRDRNKNKYTPRTYDVKDYAAMAKTLAYLNANPAATVSTMKEKYPAVAAERPELHHKVTMTIIRGIQALYDQVPKKPYDPTLIDEDFIPTRAQQCRLMRTWDMISNPNNAIDLADPETIRDLETVFPELTRHNREQLVQMIQENRMPVRGGLARQSSTYLGSNVRPMDDAAALKRMQETAGPEPMQKPNAPIGGKAGASAKITNQAAQRDMPTNGLYQLGD
jgi:hypothetical protein